MGYYQDKVARILAKGKKPAEKIGDNITLPVEGKPPEQKAIPEASLKQDPNELSIRLPKEAELQKWETSNRISDDKWAHEITKATMQYDLKNRGIKADLPLSDQIMSVGGHFAQGMVNSAAFGLPEFISNKLGFDVPEPTTPMERVARGAGEAIGFFKSPIAISGKMVSQIPLFTKEAKGALGLLQQVGKSAVTMGVASGLSEIQGKDIPDNIKNRLLATGIGLEQGTIYGGASFIHFAEHPIMSMIFRQGIGQATMDLATGKTPWDKRDLVTKAFDYGLNTLMFKEGHDPRVMLRAKVEADRLTAELSGYNKEEAARLKNGFDEVLAKHDYGKSKQNDFNMNMVGASADIPNGLISPKYVRGETKRVVSHWDGRIRREKYEADRLKNEMQKNIDEVGDIAVQLSLQYGKSTNPTIKKYTESPAWRRIDPELRSKVEAGIQRMDMLSPAERNVRNNIQKSYSAMGNYGVQEGFLGTMIEDYAYQHWIDPKRNMTKVSNKISPNFNSAKERVFRDGILEGMTFSSSGKGGDELIPYSLRATELHNLYQNNFVNAKNYKFIIPTLESMGILTKSENAYGWKTADNPYLKGYKIEPTAYSVLQPYVERLSLEKVLGSTVGNAAEKVLKYNAVSKIGELSFSFFHHVNLMKNALYSGVKPWAFIDGLNMIRNNDAMVGQAIESGVRIGENPEVGQKLNHSIEMQAKALMGKIPGVGVASERFGAVMDGLNSILWDKVHKPLKIMDFSNKYINEISKLKPEERTSEKLSEIGQGISRYVNGVYGGLNWERDLGRVVSTPLVRTVLRACMLAPDWTLSNYMLAGMAFEKGVAGKYARSYWIRHILITTVGTELLNMAMNGGKTTADNPHGHKLEVHLGQNEQGKDLYFSPFSTGALNDMMKVYGVIREPAKISSLVVGKASPLARAVLPLVANVDWRGEPIADPNDDPVGQAIGYAKYIGGNATPVPFWANALMNYMTTDGKRKMPAQQIIFPSIGLGSVRTGQPDYIQRKIELSQIKQKMLKARNRGDLKQMNKWVKRYQERSNE